MDDPGAKSYIYYGVYKYTEEYDVETAKANAFTATGYWKMVDKVFTIDSQEVTKSVLEWKSAPSA
jgi:hypothetical protein